MARQAENYADFLEHTDFEVGRLVDALEGMGELDNTLVIYIVGDNGSSAEGTLTGIVNEMQALNGYLPTFEQLLPRIDEIGLPGTSPHYAVGWAWAGDTPFQWTKQIASHFGGTRNGMFVSWPRGSPMWARCAPSSTTPSTSCRPFWRWSASPSRRRPTASPSRRYTQYFEMFGNRALYHDGWIACCRHGRLPWVNFGLRRLRRGPVGAVPHRRRLQ